MTGELSQFGANRAVNAGMGLNVTAATAIYLALATAQPASPDVATLATFAGNEITGVGTYSRQAVTWTSPSGDPSSIENDTAIEYGPFTTDPPQVTHCFLCDTSVGTSGSVMAYWTLETARDAASGDKLRFAAGDLTMTVD